jgi:hypothetical protein
MPIFYKNTLGEEHEEEATTHVEVVTYQSIKN